MTNPSNYPPGVSEKQINPKENQELEEFIEWLYSNERIEKYTSTELIVLMEYGLNYITFNKHEQNNKGKVTREAI